MVLERIHLRLIPWAFLRTQVLACLSISAITFASISAQQMEHSLIHLDLCIHLIEEGKATLGKCLLLNTADRSGPITFCHCFFIKWQIVNVCSRHCLLIIFTSSPSGFLGQLRIDFYSLHHSLNDTDW